MYIELTLAFVPLASTSHFTMRLSVKPMMSVCSPDGCHKTLEKERKIAIIHLKKKLKLSDMIPMKT